MASRFEHESSGFHAGQAGGPRLARFCGLLLVVAAAAAVTGCKTFGRPQHNTTQQAMLDANCPPTDPARLPAKELAKVTLPAYVIEPPDILLVDALRVVPKPPFRIQSFDTLQVIVEGTLLEQPINGLYVVEPGGMLDLGPSYGKVMVGGQSLEEAQDSVFRHLKRVLREPQVSLTLAQAAGQQQIAGEHLVGPDGTINLGTYGSVYVTGLTLDEAKAAIEKHLEKHLDAPLVSVDVFSYNSKVYYVITEGAGFGDQVGRFPVTGNETVLDAVAQINGLSRLSSKDIWIARPAPSGVGCDQVLPVDIEAIMKGGSTATNYQLLPGDRVFIAQDQWIAFDSIVGKITAPFERIFGFTLVGSSAIQQINRFPFGFNPNFGGGFCWVAREVYGAENPQWLLFRAWLLTEAPDWLREAYAAHGEEFAAWIQDKPVAKAAVKALMDQVIKKYEAEMPKVAE
ncbi:MAG: polysaccharide biosynthesis/export family protein [Planctomycetaceae bacterium]|nr:polysaccharide biosynthesis/export family protein [Planctomycetaceae bacterium]